MLVAEVAAFARRADPAARLLSATARQRAGAPAMTSLKERAKTLLELASGAEFLYTDGPRALDEAADKLLTPGQAAPPWRHPCPPWRPPTGSAPALEAAARDHAESPGLKLGQVAQPLRAALTGKLFAAALRNVGAVRPGRIP